VELPPYRKPDVPGPTTPAASTGRALALFAGAETAAGKAPGGLQAVSEFVGSRHRLHAGQVLISVGETTVVVRGSGKGGRAQEFALYGSHFLTEGQALLCAGTDGSDGPTDAAGAIVEYSEAHVKARLPSDCPDVNGKHPAFAELVNDSTRIEPRSQPAQTAANLDLAAALQNNDAYHYLQRMNALIKTGPTGTNLNDLALLI